MYIGGMCQIDITRIYNNQFGSFMYGTPNLHTKYRMCMLRIGTNQKDQVGFLCDILNRICHGSGTKCGCQSGYGRCMADTCTVIGIVGMERGSYHLLKHVDIFVCRTCTGKSCQRIPTVSIS